MSDNEPDEVVTNSKYPWERERRRTNKLLPGHEARVTQITTNIIIAILLTQETDVQMQEVYMFFERHKEQFWTIMKVAWKRVRKLQTRHNREQITVEPGSVAARKVRTENLKN